MSDIIPFPKLQQKLYNDIIEVEYKQDYDRLYQLFENYEAHFELDDKLSLIKCEMLYNQGYYLELREETIIFLKKGLQYYDDLMLYYVKSLNGLGQYYEAVEVIDQIIEEIKSHKTRMELFPIKAYAQSQLNEDKHITSQQLANFDTLNMNEQIKLIMKLIDNGHYEFKETVAFLLTRDVKANNLKSLMLEFLRFAKYSDPVTIEKYGYSISVIPAQLKGIEHAELKVEVIPKVLDKLSEGALHISEEATRVMNNHSILLYPLNIFEIYNANEWISTYDVYFKSMIGIQTSEVNEDILNLIYVLDGQI
ncbi:hypothetical protein BUY43_05820 [Staphylococcus devriesei]|uniref:Uncharacterized protein n=2 Tax=Staphylococcus devriesei TaxID=586733 RepID=A0A2K4DR72_9STAP|nr:hypothetical protein [Staphylococcus devriesei]MCE5089897.1 hypothetical protein [Staphylococcus devriesei]MCE5097581.1 hypothetical protein [Staphylococcus devriesei]PNZ89327.1 hypothetical protein CD147_03185 [Staphylococcus devriesei]PTE71778.1 hypothetical protein BUY44_09045 [Staphylococcus devriesei]PTF03863.1 hypothetical protein BUY45_06345 [Staphylococcus devriesei]